MKTKHVVLVTLWLSATLYSASAQPVIPALIQTSVSNGQFRFVISGADPANCVVRVATNNGPPFVWQTVGPASNLFSVPIVTDGVVRHFTVQCGSDPTVYSVNAASYVYIQPPAGFSMLSYPLDSTSYALSNLLPSVSEGTLLHWHNPAIQRLETAQFQFGRWSHPDVQILRGRAVLLWSPPQPNPILLHGTWSGGWATNTVNSFYNLLAPHWPVESPLPDKGFCNQDRQVLELIGTDGIDPVYRMGLEIGFEWYDQDGYAYTPPFHPFRGLWLLNMACPGYQWTRTLTLYPALNGMKSTGPGHSSKSVTKANDNHGSGPAVYFNNYVPGFGINLRIVHTNEIPSGSNWLAQLYGGPPGTAENALARLQDPLPFLTGDQAGYLDTTPGPLRFLTNVASGDAVVQIRYWDARTGADHEGATIKGQTPVYLVPTRTPIIGPAAPLLGVVQPRLEISRDLLPGGTRLIVHGGTGMVYRIEACVALTNWTLIGRVTNQTPASVFIDPAGNGGQQRFYRAAITRPVP